MAQQQTLIMKKKNNDTLKTKKSLVFWLYYIIIQAEGSGVARGTKNKFWRIFFNLFYDIPQTTMSVHKKVQPNRFINHQIMSNCNGIFFHLVSAAKEGTIVNRTLHFINIIFS